MTFRGHFIQLLQIEHLNNPKVVYIGRLDIYSEFNLAVYYIQRYNSEWDRWTLPNSNYVFTINKRNNRNGYYMLRVFLVEVNQTKQKK